MSPPSWRYYEKKNTGAAVSVTNNSTASPLLSNSFKIFALLLTTLLHSKPKIPDITTVTPSLLHTDKGSADFLQRARKYFQLYKPYDLSHNCSTWPLQGKSSHNQYVNKWILLCFNKTLLMNWSLNFIYFSCVTKHLRGRVRERETESACMGQGRCCRGGALVWKF